MAHILLVEDQAMFREPIAAVLEREGHTVLAVADGAGASAALAGAPHDLILLDLKLPGATGGDILAAVRGNPRLRNVPVVVLTSSTERECVLRMAQLGVSAYLSKRNFCLDRMLAVVRSVLGASTPADGGPRAPAAVNRSHAAGAHEPTSPAPAGPPPLVRLEEHRLPGTGAVDAASALRSIRSVMPRKQTLSRLGSFDDLEELSPAVSRVLAVTDDPRCTVESVAAAIAPDQAMSLRVLKLANSSVFSPGARVDSVRRAVVQIGPGRIHQIVLALGVVERLSANEDTEHLETLRFWEHSIACAIIAAEIARATEPVACASAFTAGLLHDVGRVVLAQRLAEHYAAALGTARQLQLPLEQVESRAFSLTHADVTGEVLTLWNFPREIIEPITMHHAVTGGDRRHSRSILRLILADRLAHALLLGRSGNEIVSPTVELCQWLGLDAPTMRRIETRTEHQANDLKFAMLARTNDAARWPRYADECRARLTPHARPLFVGEDPAFDAYRIVCDRLAQAMPPGPPGVAVAHLPGPGSCRQVGHMLLAAEQDARVRGLPLVLLSPAAEFTLEPQVMAGRAWCRLQTPLGVECFLETLCQMSGEAATAAGGGAPARPRCAAADWPATG